MCGLLAVINKNRNGFSREQQDIVELLTFIDTLRGEDSTGGFLVENNGNVHIAKEATDGFKFLQTDGFKELHKKAWSSGWAYVGHNRKATRGSITDKNAHPFWVEDKIVLVHNGSYFGDHKHLKDVEVDSEAIAHHLADNGNVEEALRKVNAAYALIWYSVEDKTIHVIRNDQRPLYYMETESSFIFASEKTFLEFAIARLSLKTTLGPYMLQDQAHVRYTLQSDKSTSEACDIIDCKYKYVSTNNNVVTVPYNNYSRPWKNHYSEWEDAYNVKEEKEEPKVVVPFHQVPEETSGQESPKTHSTKAVTSRTNIAVKRLMDAMRPLCKETTFAKYDATKSIYPDRKKIKVVVNDLIEADDHPKTSNFFLLGQTIDHLQTYVMFPMHEQDFAKLQTLTQDAVFEIEIDGVTWTRTDLAGTTVMHDWKGVMAVHGKNPVQVIREVGKDSYVQ